VIANTAPIDNTQWKWAATQYVPCKILSIGVCSPPLDFGVFEKKAKYFQNKKIFWKLMSN
jgi:hypothetical protein